MTTRGTVEGEEVRDTSVGHSCVVNSEVDDDDFSFTGGTVRGCPRNWYSLQLDEYVAVKCCGFPLCFP